MDSVKPSLEPRRFRSPEGSSTPRVLKPLIPQGQPRRDPLHQHHRKAAHGDDHQLPEGAHLLLLPRHEDAAAPQVAIDLGAGVYILGDAGDGAQQKIAHLGVGHQAVEHHHRHLGLPRFVAVNQQVVAVAQLPPNLQKVLLQAAGKALFPVLPLGLFVGWPLFLCHLPHLAFFNIFNISRGVGKYVSVRRG